MKIKLNDRLLLFQKKIIYKFNVFCKLLMEKNIKKKMKTDELECNLKMTIKIS